MAANIPPSSIPVRLVLRFIIYLASPFSAAMPAIIRFIRGPDFVFLFCRHDKRFGNRIVNSLYHRKALQTTIPQRTAYNSCQQQTFINAKKQAAIPAACFK